mmetsp:Transcript_14067/g.34170  ORF Transcript_14067/g.34170 Transcript_14067/m.34170 type:complete len:225 (+) Transcript_14067:23-697(+)
MFVNIARSRASGAGLLRHRFAPSSICFRPFTAAAQDANEFIAAEAFQGMKKGFVFRMGDNGLGYYMDDLKTRLEQAAAASGGWEEYEDEEEAARRKLRETRALLPPGWEVFFHYPRQTAFAQVTAADAIPYYYHAETMTSQWELPGYEQSETLKRPDPVNRMTNGPIYDQKGRKYFKENGHHFFAAFFFFAFWSTGCFNGFDRYWAKLTGSTVDTKRVKSLPLQ